MLEHDAGIQKDEATVLLVPGAHHTVRVAPALVAGMLAALPVRTDADLAAYVDALNRLAIDLRVVRGPPAKPDGSRGSSRRPRSCGWRCPYIRGFAAPPASSPFRPAATRVSRRRRTSGSWSRSTARSRAASIPRSSGSRHSSTVRTARKPRRPSDSAQYAGGREYYDFLIRRNTSLTLTPEQIHEIGLAEVARLETALERSGADAKFEGSFAEFRALSSERSAASGRPPLVTSASG